MTAAGRLRETLVAGGSVVGCFVKLPASEAIDIVAGAGFDFALVDFEHSQLTEGQARRLVSHAHALGLASVVRIPALEGPVINRFLEAGASGIQLSMLRSVTQRDGLISATRYSPMGRRSLSLAHPMAGYGSASLGEYLAEQESAPPLLVGQIETATTDDSLEDLAEGLDVVFAGTADLSLDMGHPGNASHPDVAVRLAEMASAAASAGAAFGGWVASAAGVPVLTAQGARYLVVGSDLQFLRSGLGGLATDVREALGAS